MERAAYERAVEGWLEPIVYKGEVVAHRRRYSDAMLRLLLQREDARPAPKLSPTGAPIAGSEAHLRQRAERELLRKLKVLREQVRREEARTNEQQGGGRPLS